MPHTTSDDCRGRPAANLVQFVCANWSLSSGGPHATLWPVASLPSQLRVLP
jgi:hypothetical protein